MSRATATVRFEDGSVKWCVYDGTSDVLIPALYDDMMSAWDDRDTNRDDDGFPDAVGDPEPVEIYSDYGGGWWWEGTATRSVVVGPLDPFGEDVECHDGAPSWLASAPRTP